MSFTLLVAFFTVLLAAIIIGYNWKENKNILFLVIFLGIVSYISMMYDVIINEGSPYLLMLLVGTSGPLILLTGPVIYFFIRGIVKEEQVFRDKDLMHFIPFFIHMMLLLPYMLSPVNFKLFLAENALGNIQFFFNMYLIFIPVWLSMLICIVVVFVYIFASIHLLSKNYFQKSDLLDEKSLRFYRLNFRWLKAFVAWVFLSNLLHAAVLILFQFEFIQMSEIKITNLFSISVFFHALFPFLMLLNPSVTLGLPTVKVLKPGDKVRLWSPNGIIQPEEVGINTEITEPTTYYVELAKRIRLYMDNGKPWLHFDFALHDLSDIFDVSPHHISFCLRWYMGKSFTQMCNEYRVNYAKELLSQSSDRNVDTLETIRIESRFRSIADFKKAFKAVTGEDPFYWQVKNT